jgi:hypothetical protein
MSRSHKKVPGWCDRSPFSKKEANGRVRRTDELPNGNAYKKVFESWDIHDYKCLLWTNEDKKRVDWMPDYKKRMK